MIKARNNKQALRQHFREVRRSLSPLEKQQAAINIAQQLLSLPAYQQAQHIGVYSALAEEASLEVFSELAWEDNKSLYLPVVDQSSADNQMHFQAWLPDAQLHLNSLGISEPKSAPITTNVKSELPALDLLLLPLVAYDKNGHRLGMGAGFYDRYIEKTITNDCMLVGIAFSLQEAQALPQDAWDKNLHALVNEKNILYFD